MKTISDYRIDIDDTKDKITSKSAELVVLKREKGLLVLEKNELTKLDPTTEIRRKIITLTRQIQPKQTE